MLCVGTKKGLFVAKTSKSRRRFELRGPIGPGVAVYSALIDTRRAPHLYASSCNAFFGMKVLLSTDLGKTFQETKSAPVFPKQDGRALANIWSLETGNDVRAVQPGYPRRFCAQPVSRVRPVRTQNRWPSGRARPAVPAKSWWLGRSSGHWRAA
jgi:hypothetical protein